MFSSNYMVQESVVSRANQDGTVILMKMDEGNTFFKINGVAAEVWKELSSKKDINTITDEMINSYDAPKDQIVGDIKNLVDALLAKDLIKQV